MSCWNQCDMLPPDLAGQTADKQNQKNRRVHGIMQRAVLHYATHCRLRFPLGHSDNLSQQRLCSGRLMPSDEAVMTGRNGDYALVLTLCVSLLVNGRAELK